jgi:hypothetical protein
MPLYTTTQLESATSEVGGHSLFSEGRIMSGHVHLTGVLSGRNGTILNGLVQLKHWYVEWLIDPAVSLSIEILQCNFLKNIFDWF